MTGVYDYRLVILSVLVAMFASYTALDLAGRVHWSTGQRAWIWLSGGAFAMGTGIWSMHFIGMLAFRLPIAMAYNEWITGLSWLLAVGVSSIALYIVSRPENTGWNLSLGAALMGIGICSMHYTGMAAMQMSPPIDYDPMLFIASVVIAIAASMAALQMAMYLRKRQSSAVILAKLGSAFIMGLAIAGMHYTGMAAAQFAPGSICVAAVGGVAANNSMLASLIAVGTVGVSIITLVISAYDAQLATQSVRQAQALRITNEQLRSIALYDVLTGLPNRLLLNDRLEQAMVRANRNQNSCAVMFVDLDGFKGVNDTHGHFIGDELLKSVAGRLTKCLRKSDTVARAGGDEFIIVADGIGKGGDLADIGAKVIDEISRVFHISGNELNVTCSVGISVSPEDGNHLEELMLRADMAMYQVKNGGRNGYRFYEPAMQTAPSPS